MHMYVHVCMSLVVISLLAAVVVEIPRDPCAHRELCLPNNYQRQQTESIPCLHVHVYMYMQSSAAPPAKALYNVHVHYVWIPDIHVQCI